MHSTATQSLGPNPNRGEPVWLHILFLAITPMSCLILVPLWAWTHGITGAEIIAMISLWLATGVGITVGYHRLFSHRSFKATSVVRFVTAILGGAAWQGSVIRWSSGHRHHHQQVDTDQDPYNSKRGFWWSHMGWILFQNHLDDEFENVADLKEDPILRWQHRWYMPLSIGFNLGVPALLGILLHDFWGMMLFAGLARVVLVHHCTFFINSLAHMLGSQRWSNANTSKDNWFLSFLTFGEGYHNYHHAFAMDYRNGPKAHNFDPGKWTIWLLEKVGLASNLRRIGPDLVYRRRFDESLLRLLPQEGEEESAFTESVRRGLESLRRSLEESLDELQVARRGWMNALRDFRDRRTTLKRTELKKHKRAFRASRKQTGRILKEWEFALRTLRTSRKAA